MNGPDVVDPAVAEMLAERAELMRIAARTICRNADEGRPTADEETLQWARDFVSMNPALGRPLGTGIPTTKEQQA